MLGTPIRDVLTFQGSKPLDAVTVTNSKHTHVQYHKALRSNVLHLIGEPHSTKIRIPRDTSIASGSSSGIRGYRRDGGQGNTNERRLNVLGSHRGGGGIVGLNRASPWQKPVVGVQSSLGGSGGGILGDPVGDSLRITQRYLILQVQVTGSFALDIIALDPHGHTCHLTLTTQAVKNLATSNAISTTGALGKGNSGSPARHRGVGNGIAPGIMQSGIAKGATGGGKANSRHVRLQIDPPRGEWLQMVLHLPALFTDCFGVSLLRCVDVILVGGSLILRRVSSTMDEFAAFVRLPMFTLFVYPPEDHGCWVTAEKLFNAQQQLLAGRCSEEGEEGSQPRKRSMGPVNGASGTREDEDEGNNNNKLGTDHTVELSPVAGVKHDAGTDATAYLSVHNLQPPKPAHPASSPRQHQQQQRHSPHRSRSPSPTRRQDFNRASPPPHGSVTHGSTAVAALNAAALDALTSIPLVPVQRSPGRPSPSHAVRSPLNSPSTKTQFSLAGGAARKDMLILLDQQRARQEGLSPPKKPLPFGRGGSAFVKETQQIEGVGGGGGGGSSFVGLHNNDFNGSSSGAAEGLAPTKPPLLVPAMDGSGIAGTNNGGTTDERKTREDTSTSPTGEERGYVRLLADEHAKQSRRVSSIQAARKAPPAVSGGKVSSTGGGGGGRGNSDTAGKEPRVDSDDDVVPSGWDGDVHDAHDEPMLGVVSSASLVSDPVEPVTHRAANSHASKSGNQANVAGDDEADEEDDEDNESGSAGAASDDHEEENDESDADEDDGEDDD